mmetsp:Transcript_4450/g.5310  ORF Transcript_4450/g.5310 Transcript_4450/m.5310 type:complete len:103 (-) Transcript_4450:235-543(-)
MYCVFLCCFLWVCAVFYDVFLQFNLAERRFKLAARLDPKQLTFSAYLQLAKLYTVMKPPRLEKAISAYETVLKVRPDHEGVKLEMVKVKDAITKSQRRRSKK